MKFRIATLVVVLFTVFYAQSQVLDVNDPIVIYDSSNPPSQPPNGQIGKWVITPATSWNSDLWKSYIYNGYPFRLRFPNNYDPNRAEAYPVIVILHGLGYKNANPYLNDQHLNNAGAREFETLINRGEYDGFVLSPQSTNPSGFHSSGESYAISEVLELAAGSTENLNINIDRISINGRSGGAITTWTWAYNNPKTYASFVPLSGVDAQSENYIDELKFLPLWSFQGEDDPNPTPAKTEKQVNAIVGEEGYARYTLYKNAGHGIFNKAYYGDGFFDFFYSAHKANPTILKNDYTKVFEDNREYIYETLTDEKPCPGDPINIPLGVTPGFDGYEWRKDGQLIAGATTNTYTVTELGTYDVRIMRGSTWGDWSPRPVVVELKDATITPDIQVEGKATRYLPGLDESTDVNLELPQGFIEYTWFDSNNIEIGDTRVITISDPGLYSANVTEAFGCSSENSQAFEVYDATAPNGPEIVTFLDAQATGRTSAFLTWGYNTSDANLATGIEIYRSELSEGGFEFIEYLDASVNSYDDLALLPDTRYFYQVRTVNGNAASIESMSAEITTPTDTIPPTVPQNLVVTNTTSSSISLQWDPSTDDVAMGDYEIFENGNKILTTTDPSVTIYNLVEGNSYSYWVVAKDQFGNKSAESNRVVELLGGTVPSEVIDKPTNFVATPISPTAIDLTWESSDPDVTHFQLYRTKTAINNLETVAVINGNDRSFRDTKLEAETDYTYKLIAFGQYGQSGGINTLDPLVHLNFDSSVTSDNSGNNVNSTTSGQPSLDGTQKIQGSSSVSFANNGSFINIDNGNQFIHKRFTDRSIAFWIYTESTSGIQDVFDEGGSTNGFGVRINNGTIEFGVQDNHVIHLISSPIVTNKWTHVACKFDNNTMQLFVDGNPVAYKNDINFQLEEISDHSNAAGLGATNSSNGFDEVNNNFSGWIDDFYMYDLALSTNNVLGLIDGLNTQGDDIASATTLVAPRADDPLEGLTTTLDVENNVHVSWVANELASAYQLLRSQNTNDNFRLKAYLSSSQETYVDKSVVPHGEYFYTIRSRTPTGYSPNSDTSFITIPNIDPELEAIENVEVTFGSMDSFVISASDSDGDIVVFSEINFPTFVSLIDNGDNTALVTVDATLASLGNYPALEVGIDDGYGGVANTTFDIDIISNVGPSIEPILSYTMNEEETLIVDVAASDPNDPNLSWVVDNLPSFGVATPNANGTQISFEFNPSLGDAGVYHIDLTVNDNNSIEAKEDKVSFELFVVDQTPLEEYKLHVNFGPSGAYWEGSIPWNNFARQPNAGEVLSNLVSDLGETTNVSVELITAWNGTSVDGVEGNETGIYPDEVRKSYYYSTGDLETLRVSGLNASSKYDFDLFPSRGGGATSGRLTTFEINGVSVTVNGASNASDLAQFYDVSPLGTGNNGYIDINISKEEVFTLINAMVITGINGLDTAPISPTALAISVDDLIQLTWQDNAYNEDGYRVYRASSLSGPFTLLSTLDPDETSFIDGGIPTETSYYYYVEAFNTFGSGESLIEETFVPNLAPIFVGDLDLEVVMNAGEDLTLDFNATDSPGDIISYNLSNAPQFVSLNDNLDGSASLLINTEFADAGLYDNVTISITDGSLITEHSFLLNVELAGTESYLINFTSGAAGPAPWNNISSSGAGALLSNIVSTAGDVSSISLEVVDAWNGSNSFGMTGGIFPDQVTTTFFYANNTNTKRLRIAGLDDANVYKFGFFASRDGSGDRTTEYTIGNSSVILDAAFNTSEVVYIDNIRSVAGEVLIEMNKLPSASFGYINALTIDGKLFIPGDIVIDPIDLQVGGLSESEIGLRWNENVPSETSVEVWRSTSKDEASFSLHTTLPANSTSYTDNTINPDQLYYYQVKIPDTDSTYASNYAGASTVIFSILVNFNFDNPEASPWNNMNLVPNFELELEKDNLGNDFGQNTGIMLTIPGENPNYSNYGFAGVNDIGMSTGDNSGAVPDNVMGNTYYLLPGYTGEIIFSKVNLGLGFSMEFFASRNGGGDRTTIYTIGDQSVTLDAAYNTHNTATINYAEPNENSELAVQLTPTASASYGYVGAVMMHAYLRDNNFNNARLDIDYNELLALASKPTNVLESQTIDLVYPNPFLDYLNIEVDWDGSNPVQSIRLIGLNGQIVEVADDKLAGKTSSWNIDTEGLSRGVYFLEVIRSNGARSINKLIKK